MQDTYNLIESAVQKLLGVTARWRSRRPEEMAGELGLVLTAPQESVSLEGRGERDRLVGSGGAQGPAQRAGAESEIGTGDGFEGGCERGCGGG